MKTFYIWYLLALVAIPISCNANNNPTIALQSDNTHQIFTTKTDPNTKNIQVALLLDTSNSMDGLIDQAKAQLWEIVNELSYAKCGHYAIKLQIALYEYGNDHLSSKEGYLRQVLPFSDDLDEISKELFALRTNGGNEYCGKVINTSINQLDWKKNNEHLKLIFIAGNEPFTQGPVNYTDAAMDAMEKDITINTIFCGNYTQGIETKWKDGADLTKGKYSAIDHNKETIHIATPYDEIILKLNRKLNNTYIYYGNEGSKKMSLQAEQDSNARSYSDANAVSRTISKSSGFYKNKSWDLVDAAEDKDFELKQYITKKSNERKEVQKKINELNKKRVAYIKSNRNKNESNLETALINAIKTQGKRKAFSWDE